MTLELKDGTIIRGVLEDSQDNMNCTLRVNIKLLFLLLFLFLLLLLFNINNI